LSEKPQKTEDDHLRDAQESLLDATLVHVPFDGWSDQALTAALADSGVERDLARLSCPRGALDLAVAWHRRADRDMRTAIDAADLSGLRYSERITQAVWLRLEAITDREIARASATFFAMPAHAGQGAALVWETSDHIWNALGDSSRDVNWYSKRAILSGVYSATFLYWLGDQSEGARDSRAFLERRIANVMSFEKFKGQMRKNPLFQALAKGPGRLIDKITAPGAKDVSHLPGSYGPDN